MSAVGSSKQRHPNKAVSGLTSQLPVSPVSSSNHFQHSHPLAHVPSTTPPKNRALSQRRPRPHYRGHMPPPCREFTAASSENFGGRRPEEREPILHLPRAASRSSDGRGHGDGDVVQTAGKRRVERFGPPHAKVPGTHCYRARGGARDGQPGAGKCDLRSLFGGGVHWRSFSLGPVPSSNFPINVVGVHKLIDRATKV